MQLVHILATNHLAVKQGLLSLWVGSRGTTIMFLHKYIYCILILYFSYKGLFTKRFFYLFSTNKKKKLRWYPHLPGPKIKTLHLLLGIKANTFPNDRNLALVQPFSWTCKDGHRSRLNQTSWIRFGRTSFGD